MHTRGRTTLALFLLLAPFPAAASGTPAPVPLPARLAVPASARQGDPFFVLAWPAVPDAPDLGAPGTFARIRYSDGSTGPAFPAWTPPRPPMDARLRYLLASEEGRPGLSPAWKAASRRAGFALAAIPVDAPAGPATLSLENGSGVLGTAVLVVLERVFPSETIVLTPALTGIRADPDPRKDEQARRYQALIGSADPAALFLQGGFRRPVAGNRQTSLFGHRRTYRYSTGGTATSVHAGIDYGYPTGTPVSAAGAGRVVMAEDRLTTGLTVVIEHLPGVFTIYMHLSAISAKAGDILGRGDPLGLVGATGLATGPHLHWELRVGGVACDPEALIGLDKVPDIRTMYPAIEGG